jgi:hypothetical protein
MRNISRYVAAVSAIIALAAPSVALAQGRGRGHGKPGKGQVETVERDVVIDRDGHVRVIREYAHAGSLPPGLAKRQPLPPGLHEQLHERGELPPGLQKRLVPVPVVLERRLPPIPHYYHRYFAGDDLLVIDGRTHRIVAIVANVWG